MHFFQYWKPPVQRRILLAMKLSVFFLILGIMQVSARSTAQNVSITGKDIPLKKVFKEIRQQAGYVFFYDAELLKQAKPVTVDIKNVPIESALNLVFKDQPLTWIIENKTITIVSKPVTVASLLGEFLAPPPIEVHGVVTDENGKALEGVSVIIKGTNKGTSTDANGRFSIQVNNNSVLEFSRVGYEPKAVEVKGRKEINVKMTINLTTQQEIVIASTGYQTISKERSTGSYDVVGVDQLDKPTTNIGDRLVGQVAGLQTTMDVDGNPTFQIRGQTSLYANSAPLIVVDGFPIQGDLTSVNPNDVESITILKDAAAASIWGARSANGVIVITTRSAKKGTPLRVDLNLFTRVGKKFDLDYVNPLASSAETVDYEKLLFSKNWTPLSNNGSLSNSYYSYSPVSTAINENKLGFLSDDDMNAALSKYSSLSNKQQISDLLLSHPASSQVNLTLYGGSERMSNVFSLLYETNQSNFTRTYNDRYMLNYRTSAKVFNWLDFNLNGMVQYNDIHNSGATLDDIQNMEPYEMLLNPDGTYNNIAQFYWPVMDRYVPMNKFPYPDWTYNPLQEMRNRNVSAKEIDIRLQGGLTFHLMKGLSFDSKIQYEGISDNNRGLYSDQTFYVRSTVDEATSWDPTTNAITQNLPKGGILTQSSQGIDAFDFRNQVNFDRQFGEKHEISFVAGSEINNIITKSNGYPIAYGYNDQTLTVGTFPNGPGGPSHRLTDWQGQDENFNYSNSFTYRSDRFFSLYGNLAYTYDKKYTVSGSARTDASNLITDNPKYRYQPFWSVGGSWNIGREDFLKNVSWVDNLRMRLTYGFNGNVDKSTSFMPLIAMGASPNVYTGDFTATISSFGNPSLRWERTGTWDLGFDFSLLNRKLFGKLDVYNKNGKDLIATISIPAVNGTTTQKLNNASMTNKGVELTLGTTVGIRGNDITWRGSMNFSYNRNRITKLFVAQYAQYSLTDGGTEAYVVGKDANTLWAFQYAGIEQDDNEPVVKGAGKALYNFSTWAPGNALDYMVPMGTQVAPYGLGFTSEFKIYDFDFSFIVTGKFGHVFNRMSFNYPPLFAGRVLPNSQLTEVMKGDPNKIVPLPLNQDESRFYFWDRFYPYMNYLAVNASFLRMQEINLTYTISHHLLERVGLKGDFKVYAQGNNLFTVVANKYGEDPEFPQGTMKPMPQYTFGARITF